MKLAPAPGDAVTFPTLLGLLTLVVGVPLNLLVSVRLWQLHKLLPENRVVRERQITAVAVLLLTLVFGAIFVQNDLVPPPLALNETRIITRLVTLVVAVVTAVYFIAIHTERGEAQTSMDAHTTALDANTQAMNDPATRVSRDANTLALDSNTEAMDRAAAAPPAEVHVVQDEDDPAIRVKPVEDK